RSPWGSSSSTSERRRAQRNIFSLSLQTGYAFDSNVTYQGETGSADIISGREDGKITNLLRIDYVPHTSQTSALALGVEVSDSRHFLVDEYDLQEFAARARYSYQLSWNWTLDLQYEYAFAQLGEDSFLSNHALSPSLTYHWRQRGNRFAFDRTTLDYRIEARDYFFHTEPEFDRDGFVNGVGVAQSFLIRPLPDCDWTWVVSTGARFESIATEGSEFDRFAQTLFGSVEIPFENPLLPDRNLTAQVFGSCEIDHYRHDSLIDTRRRAERDDIIARLGMVLSQELLKTLEDGDLNLHMGIIWNDSDSDVRTRGFGSPFTYDKWVAGIQLQWRF
ncbi:MAG: hypothetical protein AABZ47_04870, partial [Planctomycetota bacterium]